MCSLERAFEVAERRKRLWRRQNGLGRSLHLGGGQSVDGGHLRRGVELRRVAHSALGQEARHVWAESETEQRLNSGGRDVRLTGGGKAREHLARGTALCAVKFRRVNAWAGQAVQHSQTPKAKSKRHNKRRARGKLPAVSDLRTARTLRIAECACEGVNAQARTPN